MNTATMSSRPPSTAVPAGAPAGPAEAKPSLPPYVRILPSQLKCLPGLSSTDKLVLMTINDHDKGDKPSPGGHHACFLKNATLANAIDRSVATVKRSVARLIRHGVLVEITGRHSIMYRRVVLPVGKVELASKKAGGFEPGREPPGGSYVEPQIGIESFFFQKKDIPTLQRREEASASADAVFLPEPNTTSQSTMDTPGATASPGPHELDSTPIDIPRSNPDHPSNKFKKGRDYVADMAALPNISDLKALFPALIFPGETSAGSVEDQPPKGRVFKMTKRLARRFMQRVNSGVLSPYRLELVLKNINALRTGALWIEKPIPMPGSFEDLLNTKLIEAHLKCACQQESRHLINLCRVRQNELQRFLPERTREEFDDAIPPSGEELLSGDLFNLELELKATIPEINFLIECRERLVDLARPEKIRELEEKFIVDLGGAHGPTW